MDYIPYNVRVYVPTTEVWLAAALGPEQYVEVRFHKKPSAKNIATLLAMIELCRDTATDAAPQGGRPITKTYSKEYPAGEPAAAASEPQVGDDGS